MFANFFVPGESQGIHTDVPEFRGTNRNNAPEWMMVCMHHSQLFKRWHMVIATAISWFSDHTGGELVYYKDRDCAGTAHPTPFNSAIVLDTDSVRDRETRPILYNIIFYSACASACACACASACTSACACAIVLVL